VLDLAEAGWKKQAHPLALIFQHLLEAYNR